MPVARGYSLFLGQMHGKMLEIVEKCNHVTTTQHTSPCTCGEVVCRRRMIVPTNCRCTSFLISQMARLNHLEITSAKNEPQMIMLMFSIVTE